MEDNAKAFKTYPTLTIQMKLNPYFAGTPGAMVLLTPAPALLLSLR
jgi:hypothetical protein